MNFLFDHLWIELTIVGIAVFLTYLSFQKQSVPELHSVSEVYVGRPAISSIWEQQLRDLSFKRVGRFDVSTTNQVQMYIHAYLSPDRLYLAVIADVRSSVESFSVIEFDTSLAPHGNITTSTSKEANIYYSPPDKTVVKVPWKKDVSELLQLHTSLCETAKEVLFVPSPLEPLTVREYIIEQMRRDFEYQVKCGRMTMVSRDAYRPTFKGALIAVPLVWSKMVHAFAYGLHRPSNKAHCQRLIRRLQKARVVSEPCGVT